MSAKDLPNPDNRKTFQRLDDKRFLEDGLEIYKQLKKKFPLRCILLHKRKPFLTG